MGTKAFASLCAYLLLALPLTASAAERLAPPDSIYRIGIFSSRTARHECQEFLLIRGAALKDSNSKKKLRDLLTWLSGLVVAYPNSRPNRHMDISDLENGASLYCKAHPSSSLMNLPSSECSSIEKLCAGRPSPPTRHDISAIGRRSCTDFLRAGDNSGSGPSDLKDMLLWLSGFVITTDFNHSVHESVTITEVGTETGRYCQKNAEALLKSAGHSVARTLSIYGWAPPPVPVVHPK